MERVWIRGDRVSAVGGPEDRNIVFQRAGGKLDWPRMDYAVDRLKRDLKGDIERRGYLKARKDREDSGEILNLRNEFSKTITLRTWNFNRGKPVKGE